MTNTQTGMFTPTGHALHRMLFILRPDSSGNWYIQDDVDHKSFGVLPTVEQTVDYLRVHFDKPYSHAGIVQITSDDDFRHRVSGHGNLGLSSTTIRVVAGGQIINPADVWSHVPVGAGNFWCSVEMFR